MVKSSLVLALDFQKVKGVAHEVYSYRKGEQWHWVACGPGYSNTHKVTEFDAAGLLKLQSLEKKEGSES